LVYLFVQGEKTDLARSVSEADDEWLVPPLWRHEFVNALLLHVRGAGLALDMALGVYAEADLLLSPLERAASMSDVLRLASGHAILAYDAQYVVLAQSFGVRLVTEDGALLRRFPKTAISMQHFLDSRPGPNLVRERGVPYGRAEKKRRAS
jgi:predicted nucleic acid-binding protein